MERQNFDQWLRIRTGVPVNEDLKDLAMGAANVIAHPKLTIDRLKSAHGDWAAQRGEELDRAKKHREYMTSPQRKKIISDPNSARNDPRVIKTARVFSNYLGLANNPKLGGVHRAILNITAARIHGLPLEISKVDLEEVLNALWMPGKNKISKTTGEKRPGEAIADEHPELARINTPAALMQAYSNWGLDSAPEVQKGIRPEKQLGKWQVAEDVVPWHNAIASSPGKYKEYLQRQQQGYHTAVAQGEADVDALKGTGAARNLGATPEQSAGGSGSDITSVLYGKEKPPRRRGEKGGPYSPGDINKVKYYLDMLASYAVTGKTPQPPTPMIARALEILAGRT